MKLFTRLVDNYTDLAWVAGSPSKRLAIPRNRFIQKLHLYLKVTGNTAASVTPGEDNILALFKGIRLVKGGETIVNLAGKDLAYMNAFEQSRFLTCYLITTVSQTGVTIGEADLVIPFMLDPQKDGDFNALLPAHMLASLDLFIDWGDSSDLGTGYTVTAASVKVTLKEVSLSAQDLSKLGSIWAVKYSATEKTIDAAYNNYLLPVDLPTGKLIQKAYLMTYNNSVRSDAIIADPGFKLYDADTEMVRIFWLDSQHALCTYSYIPTCAGSFPASGIPVPGRITGFSSVGIERLSPMGIDATRYKAGDLRVGFNTGSPTSVAKIRLLTKELS